MSQFEIIFVRHGEAESSFGKHPDPALSKNGVEQSLKLIDHDQLQSLEDFIFISSPKLRAIETAKPIANKFNTRNMFTHAGILLLLLLLFSVFDCLLDAKH